MNNPLLIPQPFANNGNKNTIKNTRETGQSPEDATWADGFPPVTMTPMEAGGLPPKGLDFNGIFYALSDNAVFQAKGGRYHFDATFANSIGGYPKGAILMSADDTKEFISTIANNKNNPNTNMTGWVIYAGAGLILDASTTQKGITQLNDTLTSNSVSQAATANTVKKLNDEKLPKANPVTDGSITVEASYPGVRLKSTTGTYGAIFEMEGNQPYIAVRPNSTIGGSAGQKVVFYFPSNNKDGAHTLATTSDLSAYAQLGTTLAAYGITDAYKSSTVDTLLGNKVDKSISVSTGIGLTGGGALSSSRSLAIDKANASDLTDGTANKVLTAEIAKAAFDAKVNRAGPEVAGPISIQEHAYPAVRLIPNAGDYAAIFEASGSYPVIYVRPRATPSTSTGQIAGFTFPTKTGNHTVAMTSDLPGSGLLGTQNLNDVLRYGIYGQEQNAQATSARNYPFAEAGYLTVTQGPYNYIQEYVTLSGKRAIRNASKTDGSTWAGWTLIDPADKANLSLFANLFSGGVGYQRLPSANGSAGMIIQAGTVTVGDNQIATVTLPIAFPNQFLAVVGMGEYDSAITSATVMGTHGKIMSLSQFKIGVSASFDSATSNTSWIAIGR